MVRWEPRAARHGRLWLSRLQRSEPDNDGGWLSTSLAFWPAIRGELTVGHKGDQAWEGSQGPSHASPFSANRRLLIQPPIFACQHLPCWKLRRLSFVLKGRPMGSGSVQHCLLLLNIVCNIQVTDVSRIFCWVWSDQEHILHTPGTGMLPTLGCYRVSTLWPRMTPRTWLLSF